MSSDGTRRLATRLERMAYIIRLKARHFSNPELWMHRIQELEHLGRQGSDAAPIVVDLLVSYLRRERRANRRHDTYAAIFGRGPRCDEAWGDLARAASATLIIMGDAASDALIRAYQNPRYSKAERWWFLHALAEIADPHTIPFLKELAENEGEARRGIERVWVRLATGDPS